MDDSNANVEMLTGEAPFVGATVQALIAKRFVHTPPIRFRLWFVLCP